MSHSRAARRQDDAPGRAFARFIEEQHASFALLERGRLEATPLSNGAGLHVQNGIGRDHVALTRMTRILTEESGSISDPYDTGSNDDYDSLDPDEMTYEELRALEETMGFVNKGLDEKSIRALPVTEYCSVKEGVLDEEQCTVCRCEFERLHTVKVLPCGHVFHPGCIDQWLRISKKCPICNREAKQTP